MSVIKKFIAPFQSILLKRRMCVGCTHPLDTAPIRDSLSENKVIVQCKCRRRYILDRETNIYRRATMEEDYQYAKQKSELKKAQEKKPE